MKYLKLFEDIDYSHEEWDEEDEEMFNIEKVEKFEERIIDIIDEMEELFDDGHGDQLEEPDDENITEQMDELVNDIKMSKYDIKEVIERNKGKKNHINDFIHLLDYYLEDDSRTYEPGEPLDTPNYGDELLRRAGRFLYND